ncbi:class I SAM-dependent methyltransferase [Streptomyces sp. NPDC056749]|uniref:class I SAM-dependent methyltransferase n=1 Tax=Streptomyces sp. NPDC056749 TaxID=3345936 RepID=UPI0036C0DB04
MPHRIDWGFWPGIGPGAELLGDIRGRRVLDIGCGPGHHAVHLARSHGALVSGIDISPTQHRRALDAHGAESGVRFICADIADHLAGTEPYEAAYGLRSFGCIDPHHLLPALRDGLTHGAPLVFSALHTDSEGHGPSGSVIPRHEVIRLRDEEPIATQIWALDPHLWAELLAAHHFTVTATHLLRAPEAGSPVVVQVIQARRRMDRG